VGASAGIWGNEMADKQAKRALLKDIIAMQIKKMSKEEVKSIIWEKINQRWQERRKGDSCIIFKGMPKEIG